MRFAIFMLTCVFLLNPLELSAENVCKEDIKRYCGEVTPGRGRVLVCLKEKSDRLSYRCQRSIEKSDENYNTAKNACTADLRKFCSDIKHGEGRGLACLQAHKRELSRDCKKSIKKL